MRNPFNPFHLRTARAAVTMAAAAILAGCFTEVGNPDGEETAMTASVRIDYVDVDSAGAGPDSVHLSALRLRFMEASYHGADSIPHAAWQAEMGRELDFVRGDTLGREALDAHVPEMMMVRLGAAPGYLEIQGEYRHADTMQAFRFTLPDTLEFSLRYGGGAMEDWREGREYGCTFAFRARRWLAVAGLDTAAATPDGQGGTVVLFDAGHNTELHGALAVGFSHAFNGPQAYAKKAKE
jgi:hypothetical protein